jgi:molecular chaperone GrpE
MKEHDQDPQPSVEADVDEDVIAEALRAVEQAESRGAPGGQAARVAELEAQLQAKTDEALQFKDKYLRAVADLDNFRKRALREKEEARNYGSENLLRDMLVVLDNMDRALEATGDVDQIKQGVKMTHEQFKQILKQHGVEIIETAGTPFDPTHHEAVRHIETAEHEPGTVVQEFRRGYKYRERLLRPSMVSVAKALSAPAEPPAES